MDDKRHPSFAQWAEEALNLQLNERIFQNEKFGDDHFSRESKEWILAVLMEEVGEVARAILEHDTANLKEEAVQVAAVGQALVELLLKEEMENTLANAPYGRAIPCNSH